MSMHATQTHAAQPIGLDGVPAATTALSLVEGDRGRLTIAGAAVEALAGRTSFEETALKLRRMADPAGEAGKAALGGFRAQAFGRAREIAPLLARMAPADALRAGIAALDIPDGPDAAAAITAAVPVLIGALERTRRGAAPLEPDPDAPHADDMLRMMRGTAPDAAEGRALDAYLTTVSDHGMNASTFACRVTISTRASMVAAVTAGYAALSGPLHGGAPGPVLDMLDAIGAAANAPGWIAAALARGERLMGFGHRIYRTRDPRADVLKAALERLAPETPRLALALAVEAEARAQLAARHAGRPLDTNVEFYTALLLDALGIDRALFTPVFAAGRVAGWTAHAIEHHARGGRLIRPDALYDGPLSAD